ncbi:MAG: HAMP domain-containing protein [Alcanivoracaceae bacterium]|nr:HAMP domain-containing protein [Alcanivoracaceae bacterium]
MKIGLNKKILIAGLSMILVFTMLFWESNKAIEQLTDDIVLSNQLSKLTQITTLLKKSAEQYDINAPRDYDSYNRDVKVYFQSLKENLNTLSVLVEEIPIQYFNRNKITNILLKSSLIAENNNAFNKLSSSYIVFNKMFWEKIGSNLGEPRLEWANSYILEDESSFLYLSDQANLKFHKLVIYQRKATQWLIRITGITFVLSLLMLIVWFNQSVVKRIIKVAHGCRKVASGDFGYQISDKGSDEIKDLVQDFNHLSGVSKSILSLVNKLQIVKSKQAVVNIILRETRDIIVGLTSLYLITKTENIATVQLMSPDIDTDSFVGKQILEDDSSISWKNNTTLNELQIDDTFLHTVSNKKSNFIKFLFHRKNIKSTLIIYLEHKGQTGFLIFGKQMKSGFNEQEISILSGLNSLFATAILAD